MSAEHKKTVSVEPPRKFGWIAEYGDEHQLLEAARKVRESGYTKIDAFTPYPVHGIDEALGVGPTKLPFIALVCGLTGTCLALAMEIWTNAIDYPYIISGKPLLSIPAYIPVTFELTILLAAFSTFLGMLALNGLPRFSNPVFTSPRFRAVTDDKYFLYVDARDRYYNSQAVQELLQQTAPQSLESLVEDSTPASIPRPILLTALALIIASFIPAMVLLRMRFSHSSEPRFHVFFDMDFQPKKKPQQTSDMFADGRSMRPQVAGTVARGQLGSSDPYYLGYEPEPLAVWPPRSDAATLAAAAPAGQRFGASLVPAGRLASFGDDDSATDGDEADGDSAAAADDAAVAAGDDGPQLNWLTELPVSVDSELMGLGQKKFGIYCAVCHGVAGDGNGLVHQRADQLAQGYWLQPTSLHDARLREQPVGQLFYTITNGKGKMAGYAGSMTADERWAVVLYVRALQRSRHAGLDDVPQEERDQLPKREVRGE
jgi:mono/diheme cytochrome c family protein